MVFYYTFAIVTVCSLLVLHYLRPKRNVIVVLGSGGHTNEMLRLLLLLKTGSSQTIYFVVGKGDLLSASKAEQWSEYMQKPAKIIRVTRPRKVHQSLWASLPMIMLSCLESIVLNLIYNPKIILSNGPALGLIFSIAGKVAVPSVKIVYVESFARVTTLSLTGKLMQFIASKFYVQWPQLKAPKGLFKAERRYGRGPLV